MTFKRRRSIDVCIFRGTLKMRIVSTRTFLNPICTALSRKHLRPHQPDLRIRPTSTTGALTEPFPNLLLLCVFKLFRVREQSVRCVCEYMCVRRQAEGNIRRTQSSEQNRSYDATHAIDRPNERVSCDDRFSCTYVGHSFVESMKGIT